MHDAALLLDEDPDMLVGLEMLGQLLLGGSAATGGLSGSFRCGAHSRCSLCINIRAPASRVRLQRRLTFEDRLDQGIGRCSPTSIRAAFSLRAPGANTRLTIVGDPLSPHFEIPRPRHPGAPFHDRRACRAECIGHGATPNLVGRFQHRDQTRQPVRKICTPPSERRSASIVRASRSSALIFADIGQLQQAEPLGDARTDLGRVAIDRLLAGEDQIRRPNSVEIFRIAVASA